MTTTNWVIRGARPLGGEPADITVADGAITGIGPGAAAPSGAQVLDASGLIALPGLVDLHSHLREPGPIPVIAPSATVMSAGSPPSGRAPLMTQVVPSAVIRPPPARRAAGTARPSAR